MSDGPFLSLADLIAPYLLPDGAAVAVGVSGGPDSMALCHALSVGADGPVHALSVDHGLRAEARGEAETVGRIVSAWPQVTHKVLIRDVSDLPEARLMEAARQDRYALLAAYCAAEGIGHLFVAHHLDDQVETFLFRLAKGSGLDGLGAMRAVTPYGAGLSIVRPFLGVVKRDLVAYCEAHGLDFISDPSNENERFARPRLRAARDVLEREGLSAKRLAVTAGRLGRAREALDFYADQAWETSVLQNDYGRIVFDLPLLQEMPEEIVLRLLLRAMAQIAEGGDYGPRLERVERLLARILYDGAFRGATLGGVAFRFVPGNGRLCLEKEGKAATL